MHRRRFLALTTNAAALAGLPFERRIAGSSVAVDPESNGHGCICTMQFVPKWLDAGGRKIISIDAGDMNGDGTPDLVILGSDEVAWLSNPDWRCRTITGLSSHIDPYRISIPDPPIGGTPGLFVAGSSEPRAIAGPIPLKWIHRSAEDDGRWTATTVSRVPFLRAMQSADIDSDGKAELIVLADVARNDGHAPHELWGRVIVFRQPHDPETPNWPIEFASEWKESIYSFKAGDGGVWTAGKRGIKFVTFGVENRSSVSRVTETPCRNIAVGWVNRVRYLATAESSRQGLLSIYAQPIQPLNPQRETLRRPIPVLGAPWRCELSTRYNCQSPILTWGDVDGDGSDELTVACSTMQAPLTSYKRMLNGKWNSRILIPDVQPPSSLVLADIRGKGREDVILVDRTRGAAKAYWNASHCHWVRHVIAQGFACQTAVAADFTGGGGKDIITGDIENDHKVFLLPDPERSPVLIQQGIRMIQSAALDVDGDGHLDLIGSQYHPGLLFWLERPRDPWQDAWRLHVIDSAETGGIDGVHGIFVGDIDRDGRSEIVAVSDWPKGAASNSIVWYRIPENPSSDPRWDRHMLADHNAPGFAHYLGAGDVNGDGRLDIATGAKQGNWFAWWEQPSSVTSPWVKHILAYNQQGATNIVPIDVDGNGRMDFVASRGHGSGVIWLEAPDWTLHEIDADLSGPHALAVGDINGDGYPDVVVCAKDSGILAWYQNDGRGRFTRHDIFESQAAYDVKLIDMNGDGTLDILVAGQESRNVVWYENRLRSCG